eukprot:CAMPEP_0185579152 /NCGR_PEP_ID=MMETSP0434-20130131/13747_1 /TAXON_ID=626734 ORGANISM="Favella taraikaensis, Strain Fe Narragansett Bay" /NCGR_SAMPLE_ID=MMETSP0434 /ASSEMBLY_ACC=CAM_ASM_000379 /LENGTH=36 /DNA_ID= /DNA_START= /DNA_END= /DNA_ORIENTATION=
MSTEEFNEEMDKMVMDQQPAVIRRDSISMIPRMDSM